MPLYPPSRGSLSGVPVTKSVLKTNLDGGDGDNGSVGSMLITHMEPPRWTQIRSAWQDAFSEFLGTMILVLFGNGSVAQVLLSRQINGDYQSISWGWGFVPLCRPAAYARRGRG